MLSPPATSYNQRTSATALLARTKRPLTRRPWQTAAALFGLWLLWTSFDRFYDYTHPSIAKDVKTLHHQAKLDFGSMLSRQSRTLDQAKSEYRKRYDLEPPMGYDGWYNYAVQSGSYLIDEYDDLMKDLRPYMRFFGSGCDMVASKVVSDDIVRICVENHTVTADGQDISAVAPLLDALTNFVAFLPDLCVTANILDQPRTVIGHAMLSSIFGPNPPNTCEIQRFSDISKINIWNEATQSCSSDSGAKNVLPRSVKPEKPTLMRDWEEATDLCSRGRTPPSGLLVSPERMRLSNVVRPILSTGRFSTFHDIKFPGLTHFRAANDAAYDAATWPDKKNTLGWRGDSSGGWSTLLNWRDFQRQAMVLMANAKSEQSLPSNGRVRLHARSMRNYVRPKRTFKDLLDIEFTSYTSCEAAACEAMQRELGVSEITTANQPLNSKLVLSMDGNGGDSDFYRKLKSNSAVIRQGIVKEWHDDRLTPWLHYIPLSMDNTELPALVEFLLGDGDYISKNIAWESREWSMKALRKEDLNVYIYRLLIEMSRRSV